MADDLFSSFDREPLPPLADASAVRARGDQRRRRSRAALAGAGGVAIVLALALGVALTGGDTRDELVPAATPTSAPPSTSPSPPPSATPAPSLSPSLSPSPAPAAPSTGPRATPSPAGSAPPAVPSSAPPSPVAPATEPSALLLTPADAGRSLGGTWARTGPVPAGSEPLLDPCGGTRYPRDADRTTRASTTLETTGEMTDGLLQTIARYSSEAAATDAAEGYERAVRGCPLRKDSPESSGRRYEVVAEYTAAGVPTKVIRTSLECFACIYGYEYYAVQRHRDLVSVTVFGQEADGDPGLDQTRRWAEAAARRLAQG